MNSKYINRNIIKLIIGDCMLNTYSSVNTFLLVEKNNMI